MGGERTGEKDSIINLLHPEMAPANIQGVISLGQGPKLQPTASVENPNGSVLEGQLAQISEQVSKEARIKEEAKKKA